MVQYELRSNAIVTKDRSSSRSVRLKCGLSPDDSHFFFKNKNTLTNMSGSKKELEGLGQQQKALITAMLSDDKARLYVKKVKSHQKRYLRNEKLMIVMEVSSQTFDSLIERKLLLKVKAGKAYTMYKANIKLINTFGNE